MIVSPTTWEHALGWLIPIIGAIAVALVDAKDRIPLKYHIGYSVLYILIAFEDLPVNRFGQWHFNTGWLFIQGDYLQFKLVADVRFYGVLGFFVLGMLLLYKLQPDAFHILANLKNWFRDFSAMRLPPMSEPKSQGA